jgi:hypothetical protein
MRSNESIFVGWFSTLVGVGLLATVLFGSYGQWIWIALAGLVVSKMFR